MQKGMVSVIIPTYNRAKYINRAIDSVLFQTYENLEVIVVDDNDPNSSARKSTENSLKKYKNNPKVKYIKHTKNKNGAAARNTGIKSSSAEYITFLDDDDYYLPQRIENIVRVMNRNTDFGACYTGVIITCNGKIKKILTAEKQGNLQKDILMQKSFFATGSNMFFRSSILKKIGGFDESFERHQDLEVLVKFFEKNLIKSIDDYSVVKCENDRQNVPNIDKTILYREKFLSRFRDIIKKNNPCEIYSENYFHLLKLSIRSGENGSKKKIKKYMKKYNAKLSFKMKIKLLIEKINKYFKIIELYRIIRNLFSFKKIDNGIFKTIKDMEDIQ